MKAANDVKLNKIVQRFLSLLKGKADTDHNHDGKYSNGARRTYNSGKLAAGTTAKHIDSINEKFYFALLCTSNDPCASATVCFDWQMLPGDGDRLEIGYTMVRDNNTIAENGCLSVNKTSTGVAIACLGGDKGHYIKQVVGYI